MSSHYTLVCAGVAIFKRSAELRTALATMVTIVTDTTLRSEDASARELAIDVRRSVVAQAPAGSGKTTLLLERYLRLLATVDEPEEILVVTFTRKAAGEIRERVQRALVQRNDATVQAVRHRDTQRNWALSTTPHRLRIQTIDAFALALARQAPVLAALPPQTRFAEDALPLYRGAVDHLFERMAADEPFAGELSRVLSMFENDYEACADALCTMLAKRDQWLDAVRTALAGESSAEGITYLMQAGTTALAAAVIGDVRAALGTALMQELASVAGAAAKQLGTPWPENGLADDVAAWRFIGEILTTQDGHLRRQIGARQGFPPGVRDSKLRVYALLDALRACELDELVFNLRLLPDPVPTPAELLSIRQIAITLSLAALALSTVFERTSTVDFTELTFAARRALGNAQSPTDLAMALDYRLRHLLVDEFQDTSVSQLDLLIRITEGWQPDDGRTFFAVGDPMQSIYRFRDAEVALMLRAAREGVGDLAPEPVRLRTNFRAAPALVDWVNRTFAPAFGRSDDPQLGRVAFAESVAARTNHDAAGAHVSLCTGDVARTAESRCVVETITRLRERDPDGSIALLTRSRSHLSVILAALTAAGIPWHASDIENVGSKAVVRDLMVLLDATSDLDNRLAWLSLLRAPFAALSLADLLLLAAAPRIADAVFSFERFSLSENGVTRMARIAPVLARCLAQRDQQPPAIWLEATWRQLGGADAYADDAAEADAAQLFAALSQSGSRRVDRDALRASLDRAYTRSAPEHGEVVVMTIHRAKGLEFDHVLVPGVDRETRRSEPPLLMWRAESRGLLISTSHATEPRTYRWLVREERHREAYERLRLLYVAVTRARVSVHLFGCLDETTRLPAAGSVLNAVWPTLRDDVVFVPSIASTTPSATLDVHSPAVWQKGVRQNGVRLKADYRAPPTPIATLRALPVDPPAVTYTPRTEERLAPAADRVLRRVLSTLAHTPWPDDIELYIAQKRDMWRATLRAAGTAEAELEAAVATIARHTANVLADRRGRWLFAPHAELVLSVPYTLMEHGVRIRLDVDRRFVEASAQRWLVVVDTSGTHDHAPELSRWLERIAQAEPVPSRAAIYRTASPLWLEVEPSLDFAPAR